MLYQDFQHVLKYQSALLNIPRADMHYSVPYAILQLLEELFSRPWLSLESPRFHRSLDIVSRCPHKNFSALRPKKWAFETEQHTPPLRSPEVGELLSHFEKCKYLYSDFSVSICQNGTIYFCVSI